MLQDQVWNQKPILRKRKQLLFSRVFSPKIPHYVFYYDNSKNIVITTELVMCRKKICKTTSSIYDFIGSDIFNLSLNQWQAKLTEKNTIA